MIARVRQHLSLGIVSINLALCLLLFVQANFGLFPSWPLLIYCLYAPQTAQLCLSLWFLLSTILSKEYLAARLALASVLLSLLGASGLCLSHPYTGPGNFIVSTLNADSWFCNKDELRQYVTDNKADVMLFSEMWDPKAIDSCSRNRPDLTWYQPLGQVGPELAIATSLKATRMVSPIVNDWFFAMQIESKSGPVLVVTARLPKGHRHDGGLEPKRPQELDSAQVETATALALLIKSQKLPVILGGDLNSPPFTSARQILRTQLVDCFEQRGLGFGLTFPNQFPLWRLDYLMVSPQIKVLNCEVDQKTGSDHRGLRAALTIQ